MPITYFATNRKKGDGITTAWGFSFAGARPDANNGTAPYLEADDVRVALVEVTPDGEELRKGIAFTFGPGPSQVTIEPAVANGQDFVIYRETESAIPVADFTDFAAIDEQDLDNTARQTLFTVQELQDRVADTNANSVRASATANQATVTANEASATAGTALSTANSANSTATQAQSAAANAVSTANSANNTANAANGTANTALINAADAQAAVAGAVSTANSAQSAAAQAVSTANTANSTANSAQTAASNAQTVANNAATIANTASTNASTALSTANAASATAGTADRKADQALEAAGLIVNFQGQLDQLETTVAGLTGVAPGTIALNSENLSGLTDFAVARTNLGVYSKADIDASQLAQDTRITAAETALPDKAEKSVLVTAGDGLTGGGNLGGNLSLAVDASVARTITQVTAGNGLSGGGSLASDRTITLGTPSGLSGNTTNATTAGSHTHSIDATASRTDSTSGRLLLASGMNAHRTSGDHDSRYPTLALFNERHQVYDGSQAGQRIMRTVPERMVWFQVYKSAVQNFLNTSPEKVTFTTATAGRDDPGTFFYYPATWYSTTLHRFTAPVAGLYEFQAQVTRHLDGGRLSAVDVRFGVNGTPLTTTGPAAHGQARPFNLDGTPIASPQLSYTHIHLKGWIELQAGDYVEIFQEPSNSSGGCAIYGSTIGRHTWFSGRLL